MRVDHDRVGALPAREGAAAPGDERHGAGVGGIHVQPQPLARGRCRRSRHRVDAGGRAVVPIVATTRARSPAGGTILRDGRRQCRRIHLEPFIRRRCGGRRHARCPASWPPSRSSCAPPSRRRCAAVTTAEAAAQRHRCAAWRAAASAIRLRRRRRVGEQAVERRRQTEAFAQPVHRDAPRARSPPGTCARAWRWRSASTSASRRGCRGLNRCSESTRRNRGAASA